MMKKGHERRYHEGKGKGQPNDHIGRETRGKMFASKRTHATTINLVNGSDKKDASEKEISAQSRDPAMKSRAQPGRKAYCVISPCYSSQFGLNQSHGERAL